MLGAIAGKTEVEDFSRAKILSQSIITGAFPTLRDGIAEKHKIGLLHGAALLDFFLMTFLPPLFFQSMGWDSGVIDSVTRALLSVGFFHRGKIVSVVGLIVHRFHFLWVFDEIEEIPFLGRRKINQLTCRGADAIMRGDLVGIFAIVGVIYEFLMHIGFASEHGEKAFALHRCGGFFSCDFEEGGGVVDVLNHRLRFGPGLDDTGPTDEEGHFHRLFKHPALVIPTVLAEVEALI